ncbi:MAG: glycosyltransferase family 4 protein [Deltaproteobacteria bacterium]|nr:glycosyltransferase family 4 protein [Deltaproteobacteria bacterium]
MTSKRVLHVLTVPDSLRFIRGLPERARSRGWELQVAAAPGRALTDFGRVEQVRVHPLPLSRAIAPGEDLRALRRLRSLVSLVDPALIHAQTPKGGLLGVLAARLTGTTVLYHMRGLPHVGMTGLKRRLLWATEATACALAHEVLCQSASLRERASQEGVLRRSARVLGGGGNGVDVEVFHGGAAEGRLRLRKAWGVPPGGLVVGFVGRLVGDKGVHELTRAWRSVHDAHPNARLVVVGPWEARDAVSPEIRAELEGRSDVLLLGEREDVAHLYGGMDVLALPSYREGFPNVPLEAAAMGIPCVATHVEGCVDAVVDGVTGILVPPGDAQALANALNTYLGDPSMRTAHGDAARARVHSDFRRSDRQEQLLGLYEELTCAR